MADDITFADEPQTLGERRAERTRRANDWSPRDLLVKMLREIDSGEVVPTELVVAYGTETYSGFWSATHSTVSALGLLQQASISLAMTNCD